VFNKETVLYEGSNYRESEIILPSCVTMKFLEEQDIKMNLLHDRHSSIARSKMGEGSLNLELREDGLYFSFEAPECDLGNRALALVKNGTYTGCSFEFYSKDYEIEERTKGDYLVTHKAFEKLTALTIAMDPAYEQTSVNAREEYGKTHPNPPCEGGGEDAEAEQERERVVREMKARLAETEV
jgi:HK97 family phage prohead protease